MVAKSGDYRLRRRVHEVLDGHNKVGRVSRAVDAVIILLIVTSVLIAVIGTVPGLPARAIRLIGLIEITAIAVFTIEYVARLWSCVESRVHDYHHPVLGRMRYAVTPLAIIDLVAILPALLTAQTAGWLLALRIGRVLRILKIIRYSPALATFVAVMRAERKVWLGALLLMLVAWVISAAVMYGLERDAQPDAFASIPHAMWWAIATLATVGYGDVVPITVWGKIWGSLVTVVGIAIFALPTAILAGSFMQEFRRQDLVVNVGLLSRVPAFRRLDAVALAELSGLLVPEVLPARFIVLRRDEPVDALYFVSEGELEIEHPRGTAVLRVGDFFGEGALAEESARVRSTVTTLTECRLLRLGRDEFLKLADSLEPVRQHIEEVAAARGTLTPRSARRPRGEK